MAYCLINLVRLQDVALSATPQKVDTHNKVTLERAEILRWMVANLRLFAYLEVYGWQKSINRAKER